MTLARRAVIAACLAGGMLPPCGAHAGRFTMLYKFKNRLDGWGPEAALLYQNGLLYGTTAAGGSKMAGTVFSFDPATGAKTTLYAFSGKPDGKAPASALIAQGGLLYGTTVRGGTDGAGTVFGLDPTTGAETTLFSFHWSGGHAPYGGLFVRDEFLLGTAEAGGPAERGMVFSLNLHTGRLDNLHSFSSDPDGGNSYAGVVYSAGAFYGTTFASGTANLGTIFKVDRATKSETPLYDFSGAPNASLPLAGVIVHGGTLYGTSQTGGTCGGTGCGTVYSLNLASGAEKVLYSFKGEPDGDLPTASLVFDHGALYGTTAGGGAHGAGIIFRVNATTGAETILHSFNGTNGNLPYGALTYQAGIFYGTTAGGGAKGCNNGCGTLFSFQP